MPRELNTKCLDNYARQFASWWTAGKMPGWDDRDREWLKKEFWRFTFKDSFEYLIGAVKQHLASESLETFTDAMNDLLENDPRSDETFHQLLSDKLAIDPDGNRISGKIGTTQVGTRDVGERVNMRGRKKAARWPVFAGEEEEREAHSSVPDPLPLKGQLFRMDEHKLDVNEARSFGVKFEGDE